MIFQSSFFLQSIKVFRSNRLHLSEAATEYTVIELDQPKHTNNINLHYCVTNLCIFWCTFYRTKNKYIPKRTNIRYFGCFEMFRLQFQLASSCSEQTVVFVKSCSTSCSFFLSQKQEIFPSNICCPKNSNVRRLTIMRWNDSPFQFLITVLENI